MGDPIVHLRWLQVSYSSVFNWTHRILGNAETRHGAIARL